MNKPATVQALREAIAESKAIERKINAMMREQGMHFVDMPYIGGALTHLENFRDDLENVISDLESSEG